MILVTGGAGYIGSHVVLTLLEKGYEVTVFDNLETGHIETVEVLKKYGNLKFIKGDLKNVDEIRNAFINKDIDVVFHFAASSQVAESVRNPQKYYDNNVGGTINLLNSMLEFGVNKIVFSSTASIYGEPEYSPIDENHPQKPVNPYGKTKLVIENKIADYEKSGGLKSVILRYFNVAGADSKSRIGEWHEPETHLIPNILKASLEKSFNLYGDTYNTKDGTCIRDYVNIEDLVSAHILAMEYLNNGGKTDCFNIGTKKGNSVKEVFELCEKVKGTKIPIEVLPKREGDPAILVSDNTKAKEILGWTPKHDLEYSIKTAYEWEICKIVK